MDNKLLKQIILDNQNYEIKAIPRAFELNVSKDIGVAVVGPRRAGKTYFVLNEINKRIKNKSLEKKDILYINFVDEILERSPKIFREILSAYFQLFNKDPELIFFDEIQEIPNWDAFVRRIIDGKRRIVVSGSNYLFSSKEIASRLGGRVRELQVLPFSFKEFLRLKGVNVNPKIMPTKTRDQLIHLLEEYLRYGGFPEVIKCRNEFEKKSLLRDYYDLIAYKDIISKYDIKNENVFFQLVRKIALSIASEFSVQKTFNDLKSQGFDLSKNTLYQYLKYAEQGYLIFEIFNISQLKFDNFRYRKAYFYDTGLIGLYDPDKSYPKALENLVAIELKRRLFDIYYYKNNEECDFICVEDYNPVMAIQVTYRLDRNNKEREARGLVEAMRELKIKEGMILTYDQEDSLKYKGYEIRVMPVWKFLL
jgi:hypothetical protein